MATINLNQIKKRIVFTFALIFFLSAYIIINRSVSSLQNNSNQQILFQKDSNIEINRIVSFSQNITIVNALNELSNGYLRLTENTKLLSGFSSDIINSLNNSSTKTFQTNYNKSFSPYIYALNKYYPFLSAYAKNIGASDFYIIEPQKNLILYALNPGDHLLEKHPSTEINKFINKIKAKYRENKSLELKFHETNEYWVGSPVIYKNELIGILILKIKRQQT